MPNAPCPVVSRLTASRLPRGHVFGYPCDAASAAAYGRLPEWPKGTVCKTVGSAYVGSNPTPATICRNGPLAAETRRGGRFLLVTPCIAVCHRESTRCGVHGRIADVVRAVQDGRCAPSAFPRTATDSAGVPLDPEWNGDQAILAVLVLLSALGYLIPWDGEIGEFAEGIQPRACPRSSGMAGQPAHATAGRMIWPATRTASVSSYELRTAAVSCMCLTPRGQVGRSRAPP